MIRLIEQKPNFIQNLETEIPQITKSSWFFSKTVNFKGKIYNIRCYYFENRVLTYEIKISQKLTISMESGFGQLLLIFGNTMKDKRKSFFEQFLDFREKWLLSTQSILKNLIETLICLKKFNLQFPKVVIMTCVCLPLYVSSASLRAS